MAKYSAILDGNLGCYPHKKTALNIPPGAQPIQKQLHLIPYRQETAFKKEMVDDGVLRRNHGGSKWTSPSFVFPMKDKQIRIVSDNFREVNMLIKRRPYPMPRIHKIVPKRNGYTHLSKMDLSIQFYCFELEEEIKKYTTIITPDGQLYKYNRLPMGIKISPAEAQAIMKEILEGLDVICYINDLGIWTNGAFDEHLELVDKVLQQIAENNLKTNPLNVIGE